MPRNRKVHASYGRQGRPSGRRRAKRIAFVISVAVLLIFLAVLCGVLVYRLLGSAFPGGDAVSDPPAPGTTTSTSASTASTTTTTVNTTTSPSAQTGGTVSAADTFFDDAAFIGDSRTEGFMLYTGLNNATFYATKGLMVDTFFTKEFVRQGDKKVTIPEDMKNKQFGKVYVMLGVNELGWAYESVFIQKYGELVDKIRELQPNATIYVQSILPVTKEKSNKDKIYNNPKIDRYNELLQQMAQEKGAVYLKVNESVGLDGGALPADATTDGIHLNREYCLKWMAYLMEASR